MVSFNIRPAPALVVARTDRNDPENAFQKRPVADDVFLYRDKVLAIFCAISLQGARSDVGRLIECGVLMHIAALAAPYIVNGEIFQAKCSQDHFAGDYLLLFQESFRKSAWWWNSITWDVHALRAKCSANAGIFTGGIGIVPTIHDDNISSDVYRMDGDLENEHFVIAIERRGSVRVYMDLMVHKSKTMREMLGFLTRYFRLKSDKSTRLIFWGMCDDGTANLTAQKGGLGLHSEHTSPMLDKTMGEMWGIMTKLSSDMNLLWRGNLAEGEYDDDVEQHREWWSIMRNTITLMDKK